MPEKWAEGSVGLVTGGASGIGRATAMALSAAGAQVVIADRDEDHGEHVAADIEAAGGTAQFVATDVSREPDTERMVQVAIEAFGRLDMACNVAGTSSTGGVSASTATSELETADWDRVIDVNLKGTWLSLKHELHPMIAAGKGTVVNVSSVAGLVGYPNSSAYCASKHGVIGLTRAAALDVVGDGVRVNVVCPGVTETPMLEAIFEAQPERRLPYAEADPIGRIAEPEEVASVITFLCSPGASYLTGAVIPVDGGWTAR